MQSNSTKQGQMGINVSILTKFRMGYLNMAFVLDIDNIFDAKQCQTRFKIGGTANFR